MSKLAHDISLKIVKLLNVVLIAIPFIFCWYNFYAMKTYSPFFRIGNWVMVFLFLFLYVLFGKTYDGFVVSMNRISEMVYSQLIAVVIADICIYIVTCLLSKRVANPLPLILTLGVQLLLAVLWSVCAHKWYYAVFEPKKSIIVYDNRPGLKGLIREYGLAKNFQVEKTIGVEECIADLSILEGTETVFLSDIHSHERNVILKYCVNNGIDVMVLPRIGDVIMSGAQRVHMFHLPILRVGRYQPSPEYLFMKRTFDIVLSGVALIVLSPIILVTAIAIHMYDRGPVFYKQTRLTKDGREFEVIKFRSMRTDAEKDGVARLSTGDNDDRITPVGRIIRKCRIDEIPQLFNILGGSMSIVGPRPERPEIAAQYEETLPEFRLRLQAKAGLTGYAQVYGKYNTTPYDKLQMDLMYIAHPSFVEDLRICFATVKILFLPESTEGVEEGQVTSMMQSYTENDVS